MAVSGKGPAPREVPFALLTDAADAEAEGKAVAEVLAKFANFSQGLIAARPLVAATKEGDFYWATDDVTFGPTGTWWISYGGAWNQFPLPTVTTAMIAAGAVTAAKIAGENVGTAAITNLAVTTAKLGEEAVETSKLKNLAVTTAKLAEGAVTAIKLGAEAVGTAALAALSVTTAKLAEGAVTAAKLAAGVGGASVKVVIAAEQTRESAAFGTLATPDEVTITLPENGLIAIAYQATWWNEITGNGKAAIFLGANQLKIAPTSAPGPGVQEATLTNGANVRSPLSTSANGLVSQNGAENYTGDVTTGQILAPAAVATKGGGICYVFAAAGTYKISIQFASASGKITVKSRRLLAWVVS